MAVVLGSPPLRKDVSSMSKQKPGNYWVHLPEGERVVELVQIGPKWVRYKLANRTQCKRISRKIWDNWNSRPAVKTEEKIPAAPQDVRDVVRFMKKIREGVEHGEVSDYYGPTEAEIHAARRLSNALSVREVVA